MVGTGMGTFQRFVMPQKQNIFSNELYTVAKSFQIWSFYFYVHKLLKRPQFCFAQAYRTVLVPRYQVSGYGTCSYFFQLTCTVTNDA